MFSDVRRPGWPLLTSTPAPAFLGARAVTSDKRRKWCDVPKNLEGKVFSTE
jgi:hypothetical protein